MDIRHAGEMNRSRALWLPVALIAYAAASLLHHAHNAEHLALYPNMPAWISPATVYAAWLGTTAIGVAGYWLLRLGYRAAGLGLLIAYAVYGLDSLVHYALAPFASHSAMMNLSIGLEAATAALALLTLIFRRRIE